jgi:hypothetical protein
MTCHEPDVFHDEHGNPILDDKTIAEAAAWGTACWPEDPTAVARSLGLKE